MATKLKNGSSSLSFSPANLSRAESALVNRVTQKMEEDMQDHRCVAENYELSVSPPPPAH